MAAPGKLVAQGTPVALKSSLGEGYTVDVAFDVAGDHEKSAELLGRIRQLAPATYVSSSSPVQAVYHLKVKDTPTVQRILQMIEDEKKIYNVASYSVLGTSIEDIFLGLMHDSSTKEEIEQKAANQQKEDDEKSQLSIPSLPTLPQSMSLTTGRRRSPLSQAFTIFHKRYLIFRRSWLTPLLAILVAVAGSCIPLFFLSGVKDSCAQHVRQNVTALPLYLPSSVLGALEEMVTGDHILVSPPGITSTLGNTTAGLLVQDVPDNATFVDTIEQTFLNESLGGVSVDLQSNSALFAWEATPPGLTGLVMLNFASNILYNNALNASSKAASTPSIIAANYQSFPGLAAGTLSSLKWIAFFGASMVDFISYCATELSLTVPP